MKLSSLVVLAFAASALHAQQPPPGGGPGGPPPGGDPLAGQIFPPEMVMKHQRALGLTDDQQKSLRAAVKEAQGEFTDLQWQQHSEVEDLRDLVQQERPDEKAALAQLDKLLKIENQIKRAQLSLALRIKHVLSPEQQQKLRTLRRPMRGPGGPGSGPGGTGGPPPQDGPPPEGGPRE